MQSEQEILEQISTAEIDYQQAKHLLVEAKKRVSEIETTVIEVKLRFERSVELLRQHRNSHVQPEIILRDQEIERFRLDHPELVAMAKQRDQDRK
jgi:hypothetical protein